MSIKLPCFSSIKLSSIFLFLLLISVSITITTNPCFAWDGYDYQNNAAIEIGSGNLVREGSIVKIYDWKKDEYHNVEIKIIDDNFLGVKIEVYDFDDKKTRFFEMNAE